MTVDDPTIREKCTLELAYRHGMQVSRRFTTMLDNREQNAGKPLSDVEVEDLKVRFESSIYVELLTKRAGK